MSSNQVNLYCVHSHLPHQADISLPEVQNARTRVDQKLKMGWDAEKNKRLVDNVKEKEISQSTSPASPPLTPPPPLSPNPPHAPPPPFPLRRFHPLSSEEFAALAEVHRTDVPRADNDKVKEAILLRMRGEKKEEEDAPTQPIMGGGKSSVASEVIKKPSFGDFMKNLHKAEREKLQLLSSKFLKYVMLC